MKQFFFAMDIIHLAKKLSEDFKISGGLVSIEVISPGVRSTIRGPYLQKQCKKHQTTAERKLVAADFSSLAGEVNVSEWTLSGHDIDQEIIQEREKQTRRMD
jgi:hypothetical protein